MLRTLAEKYSEQFVGFPLFQSSRYLKNLSTRKNVIMRNDVAFLPIVWLNMHRIFFGFFKKIFLMKVGRLSLVSGSVHSLFSRFTLILGILAKTPRQTVFVRRTGWLSSVSA